MGVSDNGTNALTGKCFLSHAIIKSHAAKQYFVCGSAKSCKACSVHSSNQQSAMTFGQRRRLICLASRQGLAIHQA